MNIPEQIQYLYRLLGKHLQRSKAISKYIYANIILKM